MNHEHLVNHIQNSGLVSDNTLHVIGVIQNPVRYHSRYRLFRKWYQEMLNTPNVTPYIVEIAFGDRHFEVTNPNEPTHLQLRTSHELWHKENMINLGVKHLLPIDWKYLCWCDGDISFRDPGWALETIHQLQHHPVVQPWQTCANLGFEGQIIQTFSSFCYVDRLGVPKQHHPSQPYRYAHSGYAWACTRHFYENVGKLMEFPILGSADHHMAFALIDEVDYSIHQKMSDSFKRRCHEWQDNAYRVTQGNLGFVKGTIEHHFHGHGRNRKYRERWQILIDNKFDPDKDIGYDSQGLTYILGKPKLEQDIMKYMRGRHEDSIDDY